MGCVGSCKVPMSETAVEQADLAEDLPESAGGANIFARIVVSCCEKKCVELGYRPRSLSQK